jgi:hypothetical protein
VGKQSRQQKVQDSKSKKKENMAERKKILKEASLTEPSSFTGLSET